MLGPWGDTLSRKLLSRLTDALRISVQLSGPPPWSFNQIKTLLIDCADSHRSADAMRLDSADARAQFVATVLRANSARELFELLTLPATDEALDVL